MFYIDQCEQLLMRSWRKAWSVFTEAYQADARDFGVHVPGYSLPAWLSWRFNFEDSTEMNSAPLILAPVVIMRIMYTNLSMQVLTIDD